MATQTTIYFEIESAVGGYVWRIRTHGNHEILCSSEILADVRTCLYAMGLVRAQAGYQVAYWDRDDQVWRNF
ncbi:MAG: hypothetical protein ACXVRE_10975 [Gaiellaceae bacterium]